MARKYIKKLTDEHFIKMFQITNFRVFNPKYKMCLSGTERGLFDYILIKKLTYTGKTRPFGGNTIRIDKQFKEALLKEFGVSVKTYEAMISKLVNDGVFNRISRGFYQLNPYVAAKGEDVEILRELKIYKDNTLIFNDKKYVCPIVPEEDPWAPKEVEKMEIKDVAPEVTENIPVMPPIRGRNATLNNCFKK